MDFVLEFVWSLYFAGVPVNSCDSFLSLLPGYEHFESSLKSPITDMAQSGSSYAWLVRPYSAQCYPLYILFGRIL